MLCMSCQLALMVCCALKGAWQGRTTAKYRNALDRRVDLDILWGRRRLRPGCHLECFFPFPCNTQSTVAVSRVVLWRENGLLWEDVRVVQWSDSNSIAEAATKARPGRTSSRADEWRTPPVRSDAEPGTYGLVMARPRTTACLPVRNRTGTSTRQRGSCGGVGVGRGCRWG